MYRQIQHLQKEKKTAPKCGKIKNMTMYMIRKTNELRAKLKTLFK